MAADRVSLANAGAAEGWEERANLLRGQVRREDWTAYGGRNSWLGNRAAYSEAQEWVETYDRYQVNQRRVAALQRAVARLALPGLPWEVHEMLDMARAPSAGSMHSSGLIPID